MISLVLLLLQTAQAPVLAFPEPGIDDTAAYQGYRTRFHRDSKSNTVQIYLEPRGGRVVNLWADAADESIGFTVRDAHGRPARLSWAADSAVAGDSGAARSLEYRLAAQSPHVTLGWFVLGSMRVERDFQYAKAQLRPFGAPAYYVAEESLLVANVARLSPADRGRQLELLGASGVPALRSRLQPALAGSCAAAACVLRVTRPSLDGRNHLALELRADPHETAMRIAGRTVSFRSRSGAPVRLTVRIVTDAAPLTPLVRDSIFSRPFLDFLAAARAADTAGGRARRLEREVLGFELLSSEEKLMAGLPNYSTYFGRDMLMTALMMRTVWRPAMSEHVIAGVLRKLSPRGDVSHEEALGGQAIRENAAEYNAVMAGYFAAVRQPPRAQADSARIVILSGARDRVGDASESRGSHPCVGRSLAPLRMTWGELAVCALDRARNLLTDLQQTRENYHMLDDEFQLPILEARYLADSTVPAERKRAFLLEASTAGPPRLALMLRELALVAAETRPYAQDPRPANLVGFVKRDPAHWRSASWRDSDAGYAGGRFAMDINAIWAPRALEAIATILAALPAIGIDRGTLDSLAPEIARGPLGGYLTDSTSLRRAIETWGGARRHFAVALAPGEIGRRVGAKLAWLPPAERAYWEKIMREHGEVRDTLAFLVLSLDSAGRPIPIVNTDPATELFLDATSSRPVAVELEPFLRPYPVGLFVTGLGPVAANDAYATRQVWDTFAKDAYHGPRVVWGREVNLLLLGLAATVSRASEPALRPHAGRAADALRHTLEAVRASGLEHSELWSYRIEGGRLQPTRYGTGSDVQLWSSTDLAVQFLLSRLPHP
jgi:hypothetical protein